MKILKYWRKNEEYTRRYKDFLYSWIRMIDIIKMTLLLKATYKCPSTDENVTTMCNLHNEVLITLNNEIMKLSGKWNGVINNYLDWGNPDSEDKHHKFSLIRMLAFKL